MAKCSGMGEETEVDALTVSVGMGARAFSEEQRKAETARVLPYIVSAGLCATPQNAPHKMRCRAKRGGDQRRKYWILEKRRFGGKM